MKAAATLWEPQTAHRTWTELWLQVKAHLMAGHRLEVEVRPARRSTDQNARLHAALTDISRQIDWAGKRRDVDTWKRLMTSAWLRARGESVEILPAIDGHGVDIVFRHTSKLTKAECSELIEYLYAWGSQTGVIFTEPQETK